MGAKKIIYGAEARQKLLEGIDAVANNPARIALGFQLPDAQAWPFSPNPRAFGHPGAGGSIAFADPEARLSFAYTMNRMGGGGITLDRRAKGLIDAVYSVLR